jgi:co-chaperonin GroES (HSP10)
MKAIGRYIVIQPDREAVEQTKGGLLLDTKNKENIRYRDATVISVGELIPDIIIEGSRIKYDRHAGHGIEVNKNEYKVIKIEDVIGVL